MSKKTERAQILSAVRSPLGFFALTVLIIEVFLLSLLLLSDVNRLAVAIGMAAVFLGLIGAFGVLTWFRPAHVYPSYLSTEKDILYLGKLGQDADEKLTQLEKELATLKLRAFKKELEKLSIAESEKEELARKLLEIAFPELKVSK